VATVLLSMHPRAQEDGDCAAADTDPAVLGYAKIRIKMQ